MMTKILPITLLFLLILYVFSALDFAIAGSLILTVILFRISSIKLFYAAFLSFGLFFITLIFNTHLDFIADLSLTSYTLFVAGLVLFFIRGENKTLSLTVPSGDIFKFAGILLFAGLIYPFAGLIMALLLGYGCFLLIFPRFRNNRWPFIGAMVFLFSVPIFLIIEQDDIAIQSAILAYFLFIVGILQILAGSFWKKKSSDVSFQPL